jgi:hypothetical protein
VVLTTALPKRKGRPCVATGSQQAALCLHRQDVLLAAQQLSDTNYFQDIEYNGKNSKILVKS